MGRVKNRKVKRHKGKIARAGFIAFLLEVGWNLKDALAEWRNRGKQVDVLEEEEKLDIEWEIIPKEYKKRARIE